MQYIAGNDIQSNRFFPYNFLVCGNIKDGGFCQCGGDTVTV